MKTENNKIISILALTPIILILLPVLYRAMWVNMRMSDFLNLIIHEVDTATEQYPYVDITNEPLTISDKVNYSTIQMPFIHANSVPVLWTIGRINLAYGNNTTAADTFAQLNNLHGDIQNPLIYQDSLAAFTYDKRFTSLGLLNNDLGKQHHTRESDLAAFLLLDENHLDLPDMLNVLEQIHQIRSGDLYANYYLWKEAVVEQDNVKASYYRGILEQFPLEAIHPDDPRLLEFTVQVIPSLLQDGVWSYEKTKRIVGFLVWQHHDSSTVETLLQKLQVAYLQQAIWSFYLAEYYHRSGDFTLAEDVYIHTLDIDKNFYEVSFRLGLLYEKKANDPSSHNKEEGLTKALAWYETYHQQVPTDIMGLQRLVSVAKELDMSQPEREYELLEQLNGHQYLEDNLPGIFRSTVVGENIIDDHFVKEGGSLHSNWTYHESVGVNLDSGLFFGGIDNLYAYAPSYRIISFWQPDSDVSTIPYAEIIGKPTEVPSGTSILSVVYSWNHVEDGISLLYLGTNNGSKDEILLHGGVPVTDNYWRVNHFLINNQADTQDSEFVPIVRNWGVGNLRIHSLSIYQLQEN